MEDYVCLLMVLGCSFQTGHAAAERSSTVGREPAQTRFLMTNGSVSSMNSFFTIY